VRVELLTVGKELLIGRTLNSNAQWIGRRLARMGLVMNVVTTIDDDLDEISSALREALSRKPDFLITVGGLGPTPDDMTLKGVARGLKIGMKLNAEALSMIKEHYVRRGLTGIDLTPARRKMAVLPTGAKPVPNDAGTAPGVRLVKDRTVIFSLPGVPAEMRSIFRGSVEPEVRTSLGPLTRRTIRIKMEGIMESALAPLIEHEMKGHPGAYIKSHPRGIEDGVSKIEVDVSVVSKDPRTAKRDTTSIVEEIVKASTEAGARLKFRSDIRPARMT
jgi:molybdenum cofactor synthesis domain-containing protein